MNQTKKVLMVISGGGFMWQSYSVFSELIKEFDVSVIVPNDSLLVIKKLKLDKQIIKKKIHEINPITTITGANKITLTIRLFKGLIQCHKIIRNSNPDVVICNASSIAIPLMVFSKLFKKKTIFIESITRINKPSKTGKILDLFNLCDQLYVQWPELKKEYRKAIFKGTVI